MSKYAVSMIAQQWDEDPYYVGSNSPKYPVTVVAKTKAEAREKALALLGPSDRGQYWRFFDIELKDVRLVLPVSAADAWQEGVDTALNHAIRNDDKITLRLEHFDGTPWQNPYLPKA